MDQRECSTRKAIVKMLTQRTGSSILDSGMIYGYRYDKNARRQLFREPPVHLHCDDSQFYHTIHLAQFLLGNFRIHPTLNRSYSLYDRYHENDYYEKTLEDWSKRHGFKGVSSDNTYNRENDLDQDFIYYQLHNEKTDETIYAIRSHNGCDARGGYSKPYIMEPQFEDWLNIQPQVSIFCNYCDSLWDLEQGYNSRWEAIRLLGEERDWQALHVIENWFTGAQFKLLDHTDPEFIQYIKDNGIRRVPKEQLFLFDDYHPTVIGKRTLANLQTLYIGYDDSHTKAYCPLCGHKLDIEVWYEG